MEQGTKDIQAELVKFITSISGNLFKDSYAFGDYKGYLLTAEAMRVFGVSQVGLRLILLPTPQTRNLRQREASFSDEERVAKYVVGQLISPQLVLRGQIFTQTYNKYGQMISYEQLGTGHDHQYFQALINLLVDLADAYPNLVALGGKTITFFQPLIERKDEHLERFLTQLFQDIAQSTASMFKERISQLLCPVCLTRFTAHSVQLSWLESAIIYYGCRLCSQSRQVIRHAGPVVAILDNQLSQEQVRQENGLQVNWSVRRALFDFGEIHLIRATDEEVERFAVQVGNDTDPLRCAHYKQLVCTISADCELSENTIRILQQTFGYIKLGNKGNR